MTLYFNTELAAPLSATLLPHHPPPVKKLGWAPNPLLIDDITTRLAVLMAEALHDFYSSTDFQPSKAQANRQLYYLANFATPKVWRQVLGNVAPHVRHEFQNVWLKASPPKPASQDDSFFSSAFRRPVDLNWVQIREYALNRDGANLGAENYPLPLQGGNPVSIRVKCGPFEDETERNTLNPRADELYPFHPPLPLVAGVEKFNLRRLSMEGDGPAVMVEKDISVLPITLNYTRNIGGESWKFLCQNGVLEDADYPYNSDHAFFIIDVNNGLLQILEEDLNWPHLSDSATQENHDELENEVWKNVAIAIMIIHLLPAPPGAAAAIANITAALQAVQVAPVGAVVAAAAALEAASLPQLRCC